MSKKNYNLHLKGYVGSYGFDSDYVDYVLAKNADKEVNVLIDSLGGNLSTALSIVAAFRNHGNVNVHFVGMNASAATIASMGAHHISMDSSAMYLVHKCSMEFFQWASANADKLKDIIEEAEKMKSDLEKMDANVAQMYASKCKKQPQDLLALMEKGGWLTAKEALEWGFVDEVTDYEDDEAPVITDLVVAEMSAAGIPLPGSLSSSQPSNNIMSRFIEAMTSFFKSNQNRKEMNNQPTTPTQAENSVSAEEHAKALEEKDKEITALRDELESLRKAPGDTTSHVIEDTHKPKDGDSEDPSSAEAYFAAHQRAQKLHDLIHH